MRDKRERMLGSLPSTSTEYWPSHIRSHDPHLWARSRDYLLIHYELWRGGGKLILVLVCVFYPDYDRGPATARPVSPSQELWIVLGGVLSDSIRLLKKAQKAWYGQAVPPN